VIELSWADVMDLLGSWGFWVWLAFMALVVVGFIWTQRS